jgi:hypothetical protein
MATEPIAGASRRPRSWLLVLLGIVVVAYLATQMFSGRTVSPSVRTTNPRQPAGRAQADHVDPAELDVRIEALKQAPAAPAAGDRNPFRFQPKPPPAPPPLPPQIERPVVPPPPVNTGPPPPTPIGNLIKFIGIVETRNGKIAAFSDCRYTFSGREGEIMEGRFRLVKIQVESAIVEYADGQGRTTLALNGQACVGK